MDDINIETTLPVSGMSCAACAVSAESMLASLKGVNSAAVNYAAKSVRISYKPDKVGIPELQAALQSIGYDLVADSSDKLKVFEQLEEAGYKLLKRKLIVAALFSVPVFSISMLMHHPSVLVQLILLLLSLPVLIYSGRSFYTTAWNLLMHRQTSMDTLVAMGTGAAFVVSLTGTLFPGWLAESGLRAPVYYESAVVIITLILLGRFFEERSRNRASSAIRQLMTLQPDTAIRIVDGIEETVLLKEVLSGDKLLVKPGNTIPVDGIVVSGTSWVGESMMTGEPMPIFKQSGDTVMAGTQNDKGHLIIETLKKGSETVLAGIISNVEEAQASKPPIQKLVDRISAVFVPVVALIAVLTFLGWLVLVPEASLSFALVTSISVLIIACPCALGLATPTALIVAIGNGASNGILFKDAAGLESAGKINTLVIDKTGTLTKGQPIVESVELIKGKEALNAVFAGLVRLSDHPLSAALYNYFSENAVESFEIDSFNAEPGKGISGYYNKQQYYAGSPDWVLQISNHCESVLYNKISEFQSNASSMVIFANDENVLGFAALTDPLRSGTIESVALLKQAAGVHIVMLTGDHAEAARKIAGEAGIDEWHAGATPQGKAQVIKNLQNNGNIVAMAGDGINDTIALATADVGIAMGSGSDATKETAAITITGNSLHQVVDAIVLSRRTNRIIRQNLFWAFIYNIVALPAAAGLFYPFTHQLLDPMLASAAMAFSSVSVVTNSLRLRKSLHNKAS